MPAALLLLAAGCGQDLGTEVARHGLRGAAVVRLSDSQAVAARDAGSRVEVLVFREGGDGWQTQVLARSDAVGADHVQLVSFGGQTGDEWNSFVYGRAGAAVSRVELVGMSGAGGHVIDGAWIIALRQRDVTPAMVRWRFLAADGSVVREGTGLLVGG